MIRTAVTLTLSIFCGASALHCPANAGLYTAGHGDIRAYYEGDQLKLRYELDSGAIVNGQVVNSGGVDPVSFSLSNLLVTLPDFPVASPDNRFDFTGAAIGENLWLIPEGQPEAEATGSPWLGFSTEELAFDDSWSGNQLQVNLIAAIGPGHVSMFFSPEDELAAPQVHFATLDGIDGSDAYKQYGSADLGLSVSTHSHVNWAFTQPGFYDVSLKFSGEHATDGYKEAFGTMRFAVAIPEPTSLACATILGVCLLCVSRGFLKS